MFSTHVLEVAEKLCDKVSVINKGKIVFLGTLDELREKYNSKDTLEGYLPGADRTCVNFWFSQKYF